MEQQCMRLTLLTTSLALGCVAAASAQSLARFEVGPVMRLEKVFVEGNVTGNTTVAGLVTTFNISKSCGVEVEVTQAAGRIENSYEGRLISYYPGTDLSRENFERFAPVSRRTLGYDPGLGWSAAFVARGEINPRVSMAARAGFSGRSYKETSKYAILTIPDAVDPARVARDPNLQATSFNGTRGGLLVGMDATVALTDRFSVAPEVRFVYGGPAQIGNKHREAGLGLRAMWRF
jgi:hypothetical protein